MFNCRMCAATPFKAIFGYTSEEDEDVGATRGRSRKDRQKRRDITSRLSQAETEEGSELDIQRASSEERMRFRPRSPEEVLVKVTEWESYVHSRAQEFWEDTASIREILMKVAQLVDKEDDPVLGEMRECIFWHGDVRDEDNRPVICMFKPGKSAENQAHVTKILVCLFADDDSFGELQRKGQGAFEMICNESDCINLSHISLE